VKGGKNVLIDLPPTHKGNPEPSLGRSVERGLLSGGVHFARVLRGRKRTSLVHALEQHRGKRLRRNVLRDRKGALASNPRPRNGALKHYRKSTPVGRNAGVREILRELRGMAEARPTFLVERV